MNHEEIRMGEQNQRLNLNRVEQVAEKAPVAYDIPDDCKILVATPNYTNWFSSEAMINQVTCIKWWSDWKLKIKVMIIGRTFVHFARSQAIRVAIDGGYTHILWLDDDAIIDPDILPRFIAHDKDVVVAPYPMRRSPFGIGILSAQSYYCRACDHRFRCDPEVTPPVMLVCPKCGKEVPRDFHEHSSYRNFTTKDMKQGLVDIDGGGTHTMLMKTSVFTEARGFPPPRRGVPLDPNNFSYPDRAIDVFLDLSDVAETMADKNLVDHYIGDLPDQSKTMEEEEEKDKPFVTMPKAGTEDMLMCYRLKSKGVRIHVDTDVFAEHIGFAPVIGYDFVVQMEEFKRMAEQGAVLPNVMLAATGVRGRDHTKFDTRTAASLV